MEEAQKNSNQELFHLEKINGKKLNLNYNMKRIDSYIIRKFFKTFFLQLH